jgi:hypothetical protein
VSTYQGWPTYETWLTYIWLSSDHLLDATCQDVAEQALSDLAAADALEDLVEEHLPALESATLESDLLRAALHHVDWLRLAQQYREQAG